MIKAERTCSQPVEVEIREECLSQMKEPARILRNFERALLSRGYLVLGKADFLPDSYRSRFEHISSAELIFRKIKQTGSCDYAGGIG